MKIFTKSILILFLTLVSCKEDIVDSKPEVYPLKVYPIVKANKDNINLDELYNSLARPDVCDKFIELYPDSLNKSIQSILINKARKMVDSMSIDVNIFNKCLDAAGITNQNEKCLYPLYFESTIYNGKEVWNFGSIYEIDLGPIKIKDISSISVEKATLKILDVQNYLPLKPEIRISDTNYDTISVSKVFNTNKIYNEFNSRYKNIYNMQLRKKIDESIFYGIDSLNAGKEEFIKWYNSLLIPFSMWVLPCLVESAKFMNNDVWIVETIWGYKDYGHYHYYVVDKVTQKILLEGGCL